MQADNLTAKLRVLFAALFTITVLVTLLGWIYFETNPADLSVLLNTLAIAVGIGEGSNIGKRATYKSDAV